MSKYYEYLVYLRKSSRRVSYGTDTRKVLDHPMTDKDIFEIESEDPSGCQVTDYKLLEVTGTFTYHVVYESHSPSHNCQYSLLCALDHKITTATYQDDMKYFLRQIIIGDSMDGDDETDDGNIRDILLEASMNDDKNYAGNCQDVSILSFQEIPDE